MAQLVSVSERTSLLSWVLWVRVPLGPPLNVKGKVFQAVIKEQPLTKPGFF